MEINLIINVKNCLLNGRNSIDKIIEITSKKYPEYKVDRMIEKLAESKFIKENKQKYTSSELRRSSINIKQFDVSSVGRINKVVVEILYSIFMCLIIVALIICINLFLQNKFVEVNNIFENVKCSYLKKTIILVSSMVLSLLFHEFAHILVGLKYGLVPSKLGISLYMNIVPMYYIVTPGTYLASRWKRVKFYIAGVCANFIMFSFFLLFAVIFKEDIFYLTAFSNLQLILVNLVPFSLTDGYFLMSTVLKRINLRLDFIDLITLQNRNLDKADIVLRIYCVISVVYIWILILSNLYWCISSFNEKLCVEINIMPVTLILSVLLTVMTIFIMIMRTCKINEN